MKTLLLAGAWLCSKNTRTRRGEQWQRMLDHVSEEKQQKEAH
jgi:hypothetical protein